MNQMLINIEGWGADEDAGEELVSLLDDDIVDIATAGWKVAADANPSSSLPPSSRGLLGQLKGEEGSYETLDWCYERAHGRAHHSRVRARTSRWNVVLGGLYRAGDRAQGWLLLFLIGVSSGIIASLVDIGADWATDLKLGWCGRGFWISRVVCCSDSSDLVSCLEWHSWGLGGGGEGVVAMGIYTVVGTGMATLAAWLLSVFAPQAAGSGIAEIKVVLGGFAVPGLLGAWTLLIKAVGVVLSVGAGLSIGKEGPMIHVCSCVGHLWCCLFAKFRGNKSRQMEVVSCAAAAGMAVAFGAPVGGVLFSLEEMSSYFTANTMWKAFVCSTAAVLTIQYLQGDPQGGNLVLFQVRFHGLWKWFEMPAFAMIGALGGIAGTVFIKLSLSFSSLRKRSPALLRHPVLEVFVVAVVTCAIHWHMHLLRGSTTGLIAALMSPCSAHPRGLELSTLCPAPADAGWLAASQSLVAAGLVKILLTAYTSSVGVPGGTLVPSLAVGALLGKAVGLGVEAVHSNMGESWPFGACRTTSSPCITTGIYAVVGGAAALGGVSRVSVSVVVIMMELTGGLEYLLPVMVAVTVSKVIGDACGIESLYSEMVSLKLYPYLDTRSEPPSNNLCAGDLMSVPPLDFVALNDLSHSSLTTLLRYSAFRGFPVVDNAQDMYIRGYVSRQELATAVINSSSRGDGGMVDLDEGMEKAPIQVAQHMGADRVWELFSLLGLRYVLVSKDGKLAGIIKKKDVLKSVRPQLYRP